MVNDHKFEDFTAKLSSESARLRSESELTQSELAQRGEGLQQSTIAKFEKGISAHITLKTVFELARAHALDLSEFVRRAESSAESSADPDHLTGILRELKTASEEKQILIAKIVKEILRAETR